MIKPKQAVRHYKKCGQLKLDSIAPVNYEFIKTLKGSLSCYPIFRVDCHIKGVCFAEIIISVL